MKNFLKAYFLQPMNAFGRFYARIKPISRSNPAIKFNEGYLEVNSLELSKYVVRRLVPIVGYKPFPLTELSLMTAAVCYFSPDLIFEWGTNIGVSARVFSDIISFFNITSHIYSIDLPNNMHHTEHPHQLRGYLVRNRKHVSLLQADGPSEAIKVWRKNGSPAGCLFFLDGDHSYDSVLKELHLIDKSVLQPRFLVHDTFLQISDSGYNIGPRTAVDDFLSSSPNKYNRVSLDISKPGMTLLY
jgi:cephalosporin hydroxylase